MSIYRADVQAPPFSKYTLPLENESQGELSQYANMHSRYQPLLTIYGCNVTFAQRIVRASSPYMLGAPLEPYPVARLPKGEP